MVLPKYALAVEYDFNGKPLRSWHDPTGENIQFVSTVVSHKNKLYIGSIIDDFIAVLPY